MSILERFSLPLLTKELIEQAQRKRTYNLRVAYAVVLYGLALWQFRELSQGGGSASLMNLGRGQGLFNQLIHIQSLAIIFLLPAITCGALTVEKEKDTLALLLLTKLSPFTIVLEKLLSRLFAMGTFQLLSLPLFAIIYGIGGVELSGVVTAIVGLICLTLFVGSISIFCSTWFRTTAEAFIMSYVLFLLLSIVMNLGIYAVHILVMHFFPAFSLTQVGSPVMISSLWLILVVAVTAVTSGSILLLASRVLVSRAFVPPRNIILKFFQRADRFFHDLNARTTGGIILVTDDQSLPLFDPISWRETRKKSLGTFRYQFRVLMLLLTPLIVVMAALLTDGRGDFTSPFRGFPAFFWLVSIICLTIHSTGVIPSERVRQSLDVLLVAPLTPSEIVLEKLSGVRRMIKILSVPFAVSILFQAVWSGYIMQDSTLARTDFWKELVSLSLATIVYMPLIMWGGFTFGLRFKNQMQAVLATFAALTAVCVIPIVLVPLSLSTFNLNLTFLRWFSPLQMVFSTVRFVPGSDLSEANPVFAWATLIAHFVVFGLLWWSLRRLSLRHFSRIVGRSETTTG